MEKYSVGGVLKPQSKQKHHCNLCNDGKIFDTEHFVRTDTGCNETYDKICQQCFTKYYMPYVIYALEYETDKGVEIYGHEVEAFDYKVKLTEENKVMMALSVAKHFTEELAKQKEVLAEKINEYAETHLCLEHEYINSIPLTTSEGTFVLEICGVCKICNFTYKGKTYRKPFKSAIDFLTSQGEIFDKEKKKALSDVLSVPSFDTDVFSVTTPIKVERDEEGILIF